MENERFQEILNQVAEIHERNRERGGDDLSSFKLCERMGLAPWKAVLATMATTMGRLMNAAKSESPAVDSETVAEMLTELAEHSITSRMLLEESPGTKPQDSSPRRGRRPGQKEKKDTPTEAGETSPGDTASPASQE